MTSRGDVGGSVEPLAALTEKLSASRGRRLDLIGVGEAMVELWSEGPLSSAPTLRRAYGGDVLNSLVMASRLGSRTSFVSRVGNDPFGPALRAAWRAEGVDVERAPLVEGVNGVYFISRTGDGEREFSYRRTGSAAAGLTAEDIDESFVASGRVLLLSGITQAISAGAQATTLRAAQLARAHGVVVAFDPNYRAALWRARSTDGEGAARAALEQLLPHVDVLLISEPGDRVLLPPGYGVTADVKQAYDHRSGPLVAGIKRGPDGGRLLVLDRGGAALRAFEAESPKVAAVDTTGAGDAWNAGLIHALVNGRDPGTAVGIANAVAIWKIARYGAVPELDGPAKRSLNAAVEP